MNLNLKNITIKEKKSGLLEVASHSVTHPQMTTLTYTEQLAEVNNSKNTLEALLGKGTIRTFFVPYNAWDYNTISALNNSGYDIISAQCSASQLIVPEFDNMCVANMYNNRPSFFFRIDGITHVPCGCATTNMNTGEGLLSLNQLVNSSSQDCNVNGSCSIQSQLHLMAPLTKNTTLADSWAVVMMHPQDFPDSYNATQIEDYLKPIFQYVKAHFHLVTFSQFVGPVGSRPLVHGIKVPLN